MIQFNISNHPTLVDVTRVADFKGMKVDMDKKLMELYLFITHYLDGVEIPELNKSIISVANNNHTFPSPLDPNVQIGEFDYWELTMQAGTPLKTMLQGGIANIDASGVIDRKCNYQS